MVDLEAKERSLRKLLKNRPNNQVPEFYQRDMEKWFEEFEKVFAEDFAADKSFIQVSRKDIDDLVNWVEGKHWGDFDPELVFILEKVRKVLEK